MPLDINKWIDILNSICIWLFRDPAYESVPYLPQFSLSCKGV